MSQQIINIGTVPNDGAGDRLRVAFTKVNENFTEVYATAGASQTTANLALIAANSALDGLDDKEDLANKSTNTALGASNTLYPTQNAVKTYVDNTVVGLLDDRGSFDASGNVFPSTGGSGTAGAILKGDIWFISVAGTLGGSAVTLGDSVRALVDTPGQTAGNWSIMESNIGYVPENIANKSDDGTMSANSSTLYPTQAAVRTYVANNSANFPTEFTNTEGVAMELFDDYVAGAISVLDEGFGWADDGAVTGGTIVNRTAADGRTQNRLSIASGQYSRKMPWGALWNRVKVVFLLRINHGASISSIESYFGICSGQTNMVASGTTDNFVGVRIGDGTGTATFTAGTKADYFNVPTYRGVTRRATTTTDRGGLSGGHHITSTEGYLAILVVEVFRPVFATDGTGVSYVVAEISSISSATQYSIPKDSVRMMVSSIFAGFSSLTQGQNEISLTSSSGASTAGFTFDQSTGVLDTLNFSWGHSQGLEIAGIGIRKVF